MCPRREEGRTILILFYKEKLKVQENPLPKAMKKQTRIGEKRILETVIENGPMKIKAIAEALGCSYQLVYYHIVDRFPRRDKESFLECGYVREAHLKTDGSRGRMFEVTKKGRNYYKSLLGIPEVGEREVLGVMVGRGAMMPYEIAKELGCAPSTVRYHLAEATFKTPNRKSLLDRGLVEVKDRLPPIVSRMPDGTSRTRVYRSYEVTEEGQDYYRRLQKGGDLAHE